VNSTLHQVVTFADDVFRGNPAHVLTLHRQQDEQRMCAICDLLGTGVLAVITKTEAIEPHLSFFTREGIHPGAGHATHAAAHVIFETRQADSAGFAFRLDNAQRRKIRRSAHGIEVDWPLMPYRLCAMDAILGTALGAEIVETHIATFGYVAVLSSEAEIASLRPDLDKIARLDRNAIIATAPGQDSDIVIRVFAPKIGLPEDPVCGTAHRIIAPYWARRLGKDVIHSRHLSARGGDLWCAVNEQSVAISGASITAMEGVMILPDEMPAE
jgi:predicted PhzF superfamily epimerase YddE/YHI9